MVKINDTDIPYLEFAEAAAPGTPAAGIVRTYAKADGLMYQKDDAGTETQMGPGSGGIPATIFDAANDIIVASAADTAARLPIGAAGGALSSLNGAAAYNSGTAFPTAVTGDRYWRTDRGLEYYFDGTRWLTTTLYEHHLASWNSIAASASIFTATWEQTYDVFLVDLHATMNCASGLSGSAYWAITLQTYDGGSAVAVVSVNDQSGSNAVFERKSAAINALLGTTIDALDARAVKTSTPGTLSAGAFVTYRLVG